MPFQRFGAVVGDNHFITERVGLVLGDVPKHPEHQATMIVLVAGIVGETVCDHWFQLGKQK